MGDALYIIREGQVDIYKDGVKLRTMTKDSYFGERSVLLNEARSATVTASTDVSVLALRKEVFMSIIDSSIRRQLHKRIEL
jgi:cGMP-dependent protein kinase